MKVEKLNEAQFPDNTKLNHYRKHVLNADGPGLYEIKLKNGKVINKKFDSKNYSVVNERIIKNSIGDEELDSYIEIFDKDDPKFPYMTQQEYYDAAEELSLSEAGEPGSNSPIIGYISKEKRREDYRTVKIRLVSKFNPDYSDMVVYIDGQGFDSTHSPIQSFMLARKGRVNKELANNIESNNISKFKSFIKEDVR